ncbi:MAG: PfkB family carbohydrate kinase [Pseudomonadota bacterium]
MSRIMCFGVAVHDLIFKVEEMPKDAVKYRAKDFASVGGGMAANAAVAIARLGGQAFIATGMGDDGPGRAIIHDLEEEGIDCSRITKIKGAVSSLSAVFIDDEGERMLVNYRDPKLNDGMQFVPDDLSGLTAVMSDNRWEEATEEYFKRAKDAGLPRILDVDKPPQTVGSLGHASHIAFSAIALRGLSGKDDLADGLRHARQWTEAELSVTDGPRGIYFLAGDQVEHEPAYPIEAVDTLGAGDVFHGALALAVSENKAHHDALRFASATAALKCMRFGGSRGTPHRDDVNAFMKEYAK